MACEFFPPVERARERAKRKQTWRPDVEEELELESEILVDKKLSEELIKELENYPCLRDISKVEYKNRQFKATASEFFSLSLYHLLICNTTCH